MQKRPFGSAGRAVSEIGFGGWAIGGRWGPSDDEASRAAIRRALELGVDFFDTSDTYGVGRSEKLIGEVLAEAKSKAFVATKVGNNLWTPDGRKHFDRPWMEEHCDWSLKNLKREVLDLWQLHGPPEAVLRGGAVFGILEDFKRKGKIRAYGVSIEGSPALGLLAMEKAPGLSSLQVLLNLLEPGVASELLPAAKAKGVAIIVRVPLASGTLSGKYREDARPFSGDDHRLEWPESKWRSMVRKARLFEPLAKPNRSLSQAAIRYVLSFDAVSVVIPGARTAAQAEQNVAAANAAPLSPDELAWIASVQREELPKIKG